MHHTTNTEFRVSHPPFCHLLTQCAGSACSFTLLSWLWGCVKGEGVNMVTLVHSTTLTPPESRLSVVVFDVTRASCATSFYLSTTNVGCALLKAASVAEKKNVLPCLFLFCIRVRGRWKLFTKVLLAVKVTKSMPLPLPSESFPNQWQVQIPVCMCVCMLPRECFCVSVHLWKKNVATKTWKDNERSMGDPIDPRQKLVWKRYLQQGVSRELAMLILHKHLAV